MLWYTTDMNRPEQVRLNKQQVRELRDLLRKGEAAARTQTRARILLHSDVAFHGWRSAPDVAAAVMVHPNTVRNVRRRFLAGGLEAALFDRPRPGVQPKLDGELEARLTLLVCSEPPLGHGRWTLRLLADQLVELGYVEHVSRQRAQLAKKNDLKPWRVKRWCIGQPSARFVAKMEDVLGVYHLAYDPLRPVICLDETSKALQTTPRGQLPLLAGKPVRIDYEYGRRGAVNLFLAVAPLLGWRKVQITQRHTGYELAEFLRQLVEEDFPYAERIVLVMDNLNTHTPACLYARFPPERARAIAQKLEWHYTPEHGSWLNIAELELSVLARQCLDRRFGDEAELAQALDAWIGPRNPQGRKVNWHFTIDQARIKLHRLYPVLA